MIDDRVAVICGGTGAVGLATARRLAAEGVTRIVVIGRDRERGERVVAEARDAADWAFIAADLSDPESAQSAMAEAAARWGRIDMLVVSVRGSAMPTLVHQSEMSGMAEALEGIVLPPIHACRAALPFMRERKQGAIVTIASDAARVPTPGEALIGAGMSAIVMFSKTLAMEAKRDGIRVNVVTPSLIADSGGYDAVMADEFSARLFAKATPLAHLGVPDPCDLATLVVFLLGAGASRITGQTISINGGISSV